MRSSRDFIVELDSEAEHYTAVPIAVGFPRHNELVFSGVEGAVTRLEELIRDGGEPVGLVIIQDCGDRVEVSSHTFAEYANETWVDAICGPLQTSSAVCSREMERAD